MTNSADLSGLEEARRQIDTIRERKIEENGWDLWTESPDDETLLLYVRMERVRDGEEFLLRLAFGPRFPVVKPREDFVAPSDPHEAGVEHWPEGDNAFKTPKQKICLRGTYGCDNDLHADEYDPHDVVLEETLVAIQTHLDKT
jgi:hypothetical protein